MILGECLFQIFRYLLKGSLSFFTCCGHFNTLWDDRFHLSKWSLSFSLLQANSRSSYEMKSLYNATCSPKKIRAKDALPTLLLASHKRVAFKTKAPDRGSNRTRWGSIKILLKRRANTKMLFPCRRNHLMVHVSKNHQAKFELRGNSEPTPART